MKTNKSKLVGKKGKVVKAWAVILRGGIWLSDPQKHVDQFARVIKTKKVAQNHYPDLQIVPCTISFALPKLSAKKKVR